MPIIALMVSISPAGMMPRMPSSTSRDQLFGLLDARPDGRAEVQPHQAGVDGREEVGARRPCQRAGVTTTISAGAATSANRAVLRAPRPARPRSASWKRSKCTVAPAVEAHGDAGPAARGCASRRAWCSLRISMRASAGTSVRDSRYDASIAKHDRERQRREQEPRRPDQQHHREEHDADGQRGHDAPARRSAARRPGWRASAACPGRGCGGCSRPRRWRRRPACRWPAPGRPAS